MKIALIDDPRSCYDCPFFERTTHYCWQSERHVENINTCKQIADWCELIDAPEHLDESFRFSSNRATNLGFIFGYNCCIDDLWGESMEDKT
ncbi:MAG: hypothetical protein IKO38_07210 [Erysipelotrichaceae bacterium]|nr:hypothetical protein [Erysipelotrichaceae bacterium]